MSNSIQSDSKALASIIQPGSTVQGPLPDQLSEEPKILSAEHPAAQGTYSDVYKGLLRQGEVEMFVCVKILRRCRLEDPGDLTTEERFERRIKRETAIWGASNHPNVLSFLGYRMVKGTAWLISPWVPNGNLGAYLKLNDVSKVDRLKMLHDANTGLAYLHGLKPPIAHGDLKPENILVLDDLTTALCDFGTSRVVVELGIHTGMTTAGASAGTMGYQAKELISGDSHPTPESDIYAMAGVILATISGNRPFHHKRTQSAVAIAINVGITCEPEHHPKLAADDPLWEFLRRCWASKPAERPTVQQVAEKLQSAIERELESPPSYTEGDIRMHSS